MKTIGTINVENLEVSLVETTYRKGGIAIVGQQDNGQRYGTLTVNLEPEVVLPADEFAVKTWSENEALAEAARSSGLFEDTGKRVATGFVQAEIWRHAPAKV